MSSSRRRDFASHDEATCPTSSEKVSPATLQATWPSLSQNHLKHCLGSFSLLLLLLSSTKHFLNKHARYWAGQGVCWSWGEGRTARGIRNRTGPEAAYCLCGRPDSRVVPGGCSAQREAQKGRITHNPALFLLTSVLSAYMLSVEQIPPACACSAFTAVSANGTLILHCSVSRSATACPVKRRVCDPSCTGPAPCLRSDPWGRGKDGKRSELILSYSHTSDTGHGSYCLNFWNSSGK